MFGVISKITITQVSTVNYPNRNKIFVFNFLNNAEGGSTWSNLTDTLKVTLPRKMYFRDESTGEKITWDKVQVYGNPEKAPLLLRGDKISVDFGYSYYKSTSQTGFNRNQIVDNMPNRFNGYITKIINKTPIELDCEDNMFACKQTLVENKEWMLDGTTYTLEKMLKEMLSKSTFPDAKKLTIKTDNYSHKVGKYITYNWTLAQVLDDLRKNYRFESFFRGNELRCGIIRYYPEDRVNHQFHFQKNIISDNLVYTRADDIRIGIVAKSINKIELVSTNSKGKQKTKHVELKTTVGDQDGEIRTLFFTGVETEKELKELAEKKLPFIKYEGFRGSFTTFGLPMVKHGDSVQLINDILPEYNGTYLVKEVKSTNGMDGQRQVISLDIRIDGLTPDQLEAFQSNGL